MYNPSNDLQAPGQKSITITELIEMIRRKTRDFKELNRLIEGVESNDKDIEQAIRLAFS